MKIKESFWKIFFFKVHTTTVERMKRVATGVPVSSFWAADPPPSAAAVADTQTPQRQADGVD